MLHLKRCLSQKGGGGGGKDVRKQTDKNVKMPFVGVCFFLSTRHKQIFVFLSIPRPAKPTQRPWALSLTLAVDPPSPVSRFFVFCLGDPASAKRPITCFVACVCTYMHAYVISCNQTNKHTHTQHTYIHTHTHTHCVCVTHRHTNTHTPHSFGGVIMSH